jgi:arabinogalactan endo-1,4-beta-galactosidase
VKVKELIEQLKAYDGEQELLVAYWDKETVEGYGSGWTKETDLSLTDEQWSELVRRYGDGEWSWQSSAADDFLDLAKEVLNG